ncbi:prepilin peptidase-dependent protein [Candidatus Pantoea deserta]|uniref:Prepilin peptidase-dependent protein n=1 Tax=Candidatus Pantoea deserta TaxID=1869313 RepID=A0A3N4P5H9_9GAMM|nr:prepilin peptidase-dependent protein [Pantoea deserta]RPE03455.1 prepilin peptidase-dependent protein [Pantoea deserta]
MNRENHHGFTLPELLCVLVIVAVLSLSALQGWQRWQQRQQLRETAQQLHGFLQRLRAQANWQNQQRLLWLMPGDRWCLGSGPKPDAGCERGKRMQFVAPYPGVRVVGLRGEPGFYGRRNMAKAGSLAFGNASGTLRLIISARGRIRLCQPEEQGCD